MGGSGSGSAAAPRVLEDVVALVMCQDPVANAKAAVTARIEGQGGRVVARLGKDVSHIVWERTRSRRPSDKAADEAQLLDLFHKLEKLEYPPVVVSPLWVEESIKAGRRLVERKYLVKKPTESLLGRTPGSAGAAAAAAKKRKRPAAVLPKPAEAFEVDDGDFSSTQQMAGDAGGSSNTAKQQRRAAGGDGKQTGRSGKGARGAAAMPAVEEGDEEGDWEDEEPAPAKQQQQQQRKQAAGASGAVGTETQAVANILTVDLPDFELGRTPGGSAGAAEEEEEDELDTPLALRFAKSSAERAAAWGSGGSGRGSEERRGAGGPGGGDRRSRLALASGPNQGQQFEQQQQQQEPEGMDVDEPAPPGGQQAQEEQQQDEQQGVQAAAAAKGVAERFSIRQLARHPERPVVVHKGTPLPGSAPSSLAEDKPAGEPIPIPQVERVTSPWALAEQMPTQSQSQPPPSAPPSGRPSAVQPAPRPGRRRSLLGVSNMRRACPAGGSTRATPASAGREPPAEEPFSAGAGPEKLPTPWSTLRPWDGKSARQEGGAEPAGAADADENQAGPPQRQQQAQAQPVPEPQQQQAGRAPSATGGASSGGGSRRQRPTQSAAAAVTSAAAAASGAAAASAGPTQGCIVLTSVDAAVVDLARSATRRLRGLRLCPEGKEDGQVTHLVVGGERRTLKLMLAVANGAWLLSPQWVTASVEAGRWLPESQFSAKVRFQAAAERARSLLESPDAAPLLAEHSIYVHLPDKARKLMGANAAALKRVAAALGAKAAQPRSCTLCVVVGGGARPPTIPAEAACVKEEWLLLAAERFEAPPLDEFSNG
ncbi:hypothetical protein ABPG75_005991 [Micractinium tetrahymenae]